MKLNYGSYPVCIAKTPVDDLRDRMLQNSKAMNQANVQRSLDALAHMQVAMEAAE